MNWHPYAQKFDLLGGEDWERFRADIASNGVLQPILFRIINGSEKQYLDGRCRAKACDELELPCPEALVRVADDSVVQFINSLNVHRRHLDKTARNQYILELRSQGMSVRDIANQTGFSKSEVHRVVSSPEDDPPYEEKGEEKTANPQVSQAGTPEVVKGRDGKTYKSKGKAEKKRPKAQPGEPPGDDDGEMVDEVGFSVPARLRAIFAERSGIRSVNAQASRLATLMQEVEKGEGYKIADADREERLRYSTVLISLANLMRNIEPHTVHQKCSAAGCEDCGNKGYLVAEESEAF